MDGRPDEESSISTSRRSRCCWFISNKLVLLPLAASFSFPATFFISYGIAVSNRHVKPDFPFISDTGTTPPESCVFGQLLNIASALVALTAYVRYRQLRAVATDSSLRVTLRFRRVNAAAFVIGLVAAFGVSLVANFQWTLVLSVHIVGAFCAFILGIVYGWLQCWLSWQTPPPLCSRALWMSRVVTTAVATIFFLLMMVGTQTKAGFHFNDYFFEPDSLALLATTSEWIMALGLAAMFATFAVDFRHIHIDSPQVTLRHGANARVLPSDEQC